MIAIERFKSRRKFHSKHTRHFNKFLKFGGFEAGERQFGGPLGPEDFEDMDAFEIARTKATHHVGDEKLDVGKWAVDFEGIAKGYL